jgi:hypothetical protein
VHDEPVRGRWWPAMALAVAALAAAALVVLPLAPRTSSPDGRPAGASATAVPADAIFAVPTTLADGSSYALRYVLGSGHSVGVSLSMDGTSFRLVELTEGRFRQLRALPAYSGPQFDAFAFAEDHVYWVETQIESDGNARSRLWRASVAAASASVGEPQQVLADMGYVVIYDSIFDLMVADSVISWISAAGATRPASVLRSMPVSGGPISQQTYEGAWRQTTRPWLVSATTGALKLVNTVTGETVAVAGTGAEGVSCSGQWCRFTISSSDGPVRLDLVRPDGSQRTRVAGPGTRFEALDPAMLGRYEILSQTGGDLAQGEQRLLLYDIDQATTREIEIGTASLVTNRGRYTWWLSGDIRSPIWHVLDLAALG